MLLQPCVDLWCRLHWPMRGVRCFFCADSSSSCSRLTRSSSLITICRQTQWQSRQQGSIRHARQPWVQQEVQLQHLKMIMNLGGFDDSFVEEDKNKVEVSDAIVKRRGHRNFDGSLCFGKILLCVWFACLLVFFVLSCMFDMCCLVCFCALSFVFCD